MFVQLASVLKKSFDKFVTLDVEGSIFSKMIALECKLISHCLQIYSTNCHDPTCDTT